MLRSLLRRLRGRDVPQASAPASPQAPAFTLSDWSPRDSNLRRSWAETTHRDLLEALEKGTPEALRAYVDEPHPGVFVFEAWTPEACRDWVEELRALETWARKHRVHIEPPNSMHTTGVVLEQIGLAGAAATWMQEVLSPLARVLLPEVGGDAISELHAFSVHYGVRGDADLGFHVDDSEVTFNLCLGERFSGGDLYFRGRRCLRHAQEGHLPEEDYVWNHRPGCAVLHAGKHRHGVLPIDSGERHNLIFWCRNGAWRRRRAELDCGPWCDSPDARRDSALGTARPVLGADESGSAIDESG